jgi:hypothetical protein
MTDPEVAGSPGPRRMPSRRRRAAIGGGAVVLAAVIAGAAFLAFGPAGLGPGPLAVGSVSSSGVVPPDGSTIVVIPVGTAPSTTAVIDSVAIGGGGGYGAPREIRVVGIPGQACSGIWLTATRGRGFTRQCAPGGTVPLLNRAVPRRPGAATIDIGIEVGPPGQSGCWGIGQVSVHYHVGGRHYVNASAESLSGCTSI